MQTSTIDMIQKESTPHPDSWENVITVAKQAVKAYAALLSASDALAEAMGFKNEYVLRRIMPQNTHERRNMKRIYEWVNSEHDCVKKVLREREEERNALRERNSLLARLNLTPEEKALLGIGEDAEQ